LVFSYRAEYASQDSRRLISNLRRHYHCFEASGKNLLKAFLVDVSIVVGQGFDHAANHLNGEIGLF
jgi:hypothetical protein